MSKKKSGFLSNAIYNKKSSNVRKKPNSNPFALAKTDLSNYTGNPFELRTNREKFDILGKVCKHNKGVPGLSKSKSMKRRKITLGIEFARKDKSNLLLDHRISARGNYGAQINNQNGNIDTREQVLNARFAMGKMERLKRRKSSLFDLKDDVLTHGGKDLSELDYFACEQSEDEDLYNEELQENFNNVAHFGGFGKKTEQDLQNKDRKTLAYDILLAEQKARKIDALKEKTEVAYLTEKLDAEYKDILHSMGKSSSTKESDLVKKNNDDYNKLLRELVFEPRGAVNHAIKSDATKDKQKQTEGGVKDDDSEINTVKNYKNYFKDFESTTKSKLRSADGFGTNYVWKRNNEDVMTLRYDRDGKLILSPTDDDSANQLNKAKNKIAEDSEELESDVDNVESEESENSEVSGNSADLDDSEGSEEDNLSDFSDLEIENNIESENDIFTASDNDSREKNRSAKIEELLSTRLPESYKSFKDLLSSYKIEEQSSVIEHLFNNCKSQKYQHINQRYNKFFTFLLQFLQDSLSTANESNIRQFFKLFHSTIPHFYHIVQHQENISEEFLKMIEKDYNQFNNRSKNLYPQRSILISLILITYLYPASEYRHAILAPTLIFISQILDRARISSPQDISLSLLISRLSLEYTKGSKRFLLSSFNHLISILYSTVPENIVETDLISVIFKNSFRYKGLLTKNELEDFQSVPEEKMKSKDLLATKLTPTLKVRILNETLFLLTDIVKVTETYNGNQSLFKPLLVILNSVPVSLYPDYISKSFNELLTLLESISTRQMKIVQVNEKKTRIIKLLEPRIEAVYDSKRRPKVSKQKEEVMKLRHKIKRGTKSAIREIRLDTQYIQNMRFKEQQRSDAERERKVKRIYQEAAVQQGELNAIQRQQNRKKY